MKIRRISPRKEPVQERSKALRQYMLEAAAYILEHDGPLKFSTNKVAERAGVNIASLYQYYPNKESLLFHLVELQWEKTYSTVYPVLKDTNLSHQKRMHLFIQRFFQMEAKDRNLKDAMAHLGFLIEGTREYQDLCAKGQKAFVEFLESQNKRPADRHEVNAEFILHTITSFSECQSAGVWVDIERDSKMMAEMICSHFGIKK